MLAYVFWHWPRAGVSAGRLRGAAAPLPRGARRDARRRVPRLALAGASPARPGRRTAATAYEDWYLLEGSAALDPLNAAAVTASRQAPHDAAAAAAEGGTAGLYLLRLGQRSASRRARPPGSPSRPG